MLQQRNKVLSCGSLGTRSVCLEPQHSQKCSSRKISIYHIAFGGTVSPLSYLVLKYSICIMMTIQSAFKYETDLKGHCFEKRTIRPKKGQQHVKKKILTAPLVAVLLHPFAPSKQNKVHTLTRSE
jgi:hypothetical protein